MLIQNKMAKIIFWILIFLLAFIAFFAIRSLLKKTDNSNKKQFDIHDIDLPGLDNFTGH